MIPKIKKILFATDLTKNSAYTFFYAVRMAKENKANIVILHSIENKGFKGHEGVSAVLVEKALKDANVEEIRKRLREFYKSIETQTGSPSVELVSKILIPIGHPVEEILKAADEEDCDMIIIGTHGKGFLRQTFLGSVAAALLARTRKPVLIVPLPSEKTLNVKDFPDIRPLTEKMFEGFGQ